ncbi:MAG: hypothetical protein ACRD5Z_10820 [Bryobacteraceae bacterium]
MRLLLALAVLPVLLSSCADLLATDDPGAKELAATLSFVAGDRPLDRGAGIYSIGDYSPPHLPVTNIAIAPGRRNIGYLCPGWIFVDGPPTVWHKFQGGKHYELYCQAGNPIFRIKGS